MTTTDTIDRLEAQIEVLKTRLGQAEATVKTLTRERDQAIAARHIAATATAAGVVPAAIDDVVNRALGSGDWIKDRTGQYVRHVDGYPDTDLSGDRVTAGKFIASLREQARFYWGQDSGGSGAQNGSGGQAVPTGRSNPWSREHWDDMAQVAVYRADPAEAERLAKAAGSRIGALRPS